MYIQDHCIRVPFNPPGHVFDAQKLNKNLEGVHKLQSAYTCNNNNNNYNNNNKNNFIIIILNGNNNYNNFIRVS